MAHSPAAGRHGALAPPAVTEPSLDGVRSGEPAEVTAWLRRDHPVAELLFTIVVDDADRATDVLPQAWRAALRAVHDPDTGDLRTVILREVLTTVNASGHLDLGPATVPLPGPYLPAGDPWEGWYAEDDAVPVLAGGLDRDAVVATLRRLPLGHRALLVLRDCAGLTAADTAGLIAGSDQRQDVLLSEARVGFTCLIDAQLTPGGRA